MQIDTLVCRSNAASLRACKGYVYLKEASLQSIHWTIQNELEQLASYYTSLASAAEAAEAGLSQPSVWNDGTGKWTHTHDLNIGSQIQKKAVNSTLTYKYTKSWKEAAFSNTGKYHALNANIGVLTGNAKFSASARLWKEKTFNPQLSLDAETGLSALSGTVSLFAGSAKSVSMTAKAKGEVGAVYAKAHAVVSAQEQSIDLGVGAAAVRGECSLAFRAFGCTVTLTGSGSIGSAEANLSWSHKNREWELGSKLGFIAGLGFKVKVSY